MMERRTGELQRNVTPAEWELNENIERDLELSV